MMGYLASTTLQSMQVGKHRKKNMSHNRTPGIFMAIIMTIMLIATTLAICWEDHPDVENHRETDRIFRQANAQTGYADYEQMQLEKEHQESLKNYKSSKFKKKVKTNE